MMYAHVRHGAIRRKIEDSIGVRTTYVGSSGGPFHHLTSLSLFSGPCPIWPTHGPGNAGLAGQERELLKEGMAFHPRRWSLAAIPLLLAGLSGNPAPEPGAAGESYAELEENDFVESSQ